MLYVIILSIALGISIIANIVLAILYSENTCSESREENNQKNISESREENEQKNTQDTNKSIKTEEYDVAEEFQESEESSQSMDENFIKKYKRTNVDMSFFRKMKNIHLGETVVLYGPGPTLAKHKEIKLKPSFYKAAVNGTILHEDFKNNLDFYIWCGEWNLKWTYDIFEAMVNLPASTVKFSGAYVAGSRYNPEYDRPNSEFYGTKTMISPSVAKALDIYAYNVESELNPNIEDGLNDFSVAFQACQILMHMGFAEIILVGFDCSGHYGYTKTKRRWGRNYYERLINQWKKFSTFSKDVYPHTVIKSANPVGLKCVFPTFD